MKNKFVKFLYSGSPQIVIVKNIVLAVIIFVIYRIVKNALDKTTEESIEQLQNETIQMVQQGDIPTNDGSQMAPNTDQVQANEVALQQYTIMNQFFVDEQAYGIKDGKNLFQWYTDTLNSSVLTGQIFIYGGQDSTECNSTLDLCSELDVMRLTWAKSGLTF